MSTPIETIEILSLSFQQAGLTSKQLRRCKLFLWCVAGVFAYAAASLLGVSTFSFETLRTIVLSSIPPGYEDRFTPALFTRITVGLRFLGIVFGACAVALAFFGEQMSRTLLSTLHDLAELSTAVRKSVRVLGDSAPLHVLSLFAVVCWGIALRIAFLGEPIRNDEAYTFMHYASRPIYVGLTYYTANNHVLSTILMHISTAVFGASVWTVRLPTLIAGAFIIPATYATIRVFHGAGAGLLAAALVSASSPLIEFSFNARGYSLGTLCFLVMILMVGFEMRHGLQGAWPVISISAALALYSVPTMLYGVAGVFLYLVLRRSKLRQVLFSLAWTVALTVALYSPVLATMGVSAFTNNQWAKPLPHDLWLKEFTREAISLWRYWNLDVPWLVGIFIVGGVIAAALLPRTLRLPPGAILLCIAITACTLLAKQSLVIPRRSWLFLLPLFFGVAAATWNIMMRRSHFEPRFLNALSLALAGWMGCTVLTAKSLRHSGIEAAGPRSVEQIALGSRPYLLQGAQFICSDYFDSGLDFEMHVHGIPYRPSHTGKLLIVTPVGASPLRTIHLAGLSNADVQLLRQIAHYSDADVYTTTRNSRVPFVPRGSTEMGVFTEAGD
ncbi:MAG TPA: glycosyltransferase family 39 protein [Bryobacteraceae bacterium]